VKITIECTEKEIANLLKDAIGQQLLNSLGRYLRDSQSKIKGSDILAV
jgi:hypothetical protein